MDSLFVKLKSVNDKTMLEGSARENKPFNIDYFPPIGDGNGYTSLELVMFALGSCLSTTLITLLRYRMKKTVKSIDTEMTGCAGDEHPKKLDVINISFLIKAEDLTEAEVNKALKASEEGICPVWAMLKGNVTINVDFEIA